MKATDHVSGISFDTASPMVQRVPLLKEALGPAVAAGFLTAGQFIGYKEMDFGNGCDAFTANVAVVSKYGGQALELRLDSITGPIIGTLTVAATDPGNWYNFQPQTVKVSGASGVHDLYLISRATAGAVCNIKNFSFEAIPDIVVKPGPLNITKPGAYSGKEATQITINALHPLDIVVLDDMTFDNFTCNSPCSLTIQNSTIKGAGSARGIQVWGFTTLAILNNLFKGTGGFLATDPHNMGKAARVMNNKGENINASTGPSTRNKSSFLQFQFAAIPDMEIGWNWLKNIRGQSATEDAISLMLAGGTAGHNAKIHDNFVDGVFEWPLITPTNQGHFSGSGIMAFDPGNSFGSNAGGFVEVFDNVVLASENEAFACAGGHDIEIHHNRQVSDGTSTAFGTVGLRLWNWNDKTPAGTFGKNVNIHDNFSCWMVGGKRHDFDIATQGTQANNVAGVSTEAAERAAWAANVVASGMTIGPKP